MSNTFFGKSYLYNDKIIGVAQGLCEQYIIAYYGNGDGRHRVRNYKAFKVYDTPEEAQKALDKFAKEHFLLEIRRLINLDYSFKTLVKEMRHTQKLYFKTRDKWALERSKELERQVDKDEIEEF